MKRLLIAMFALHLWPAPATGAPLLSGANLLKGGPEALESGPKGAVVVFLSAVCPCSNSHIPELKKLAKDFPQFQFVAVHANANEAASMAKSYFVSQDLPFPVWQDEHARLANQYKANKTPHAFVLSPKGEVLYRGGVTSSHNAAEADHFYLREALEDVSQGRPVRTKEARTLGCAISRKEI